MKTLEINAKERKIQLNLPTTLEEIGSEWLTNVTSGVTVAPDYCLIAVVFKSNLGMLLNTKLNKNNTSISAVPLFVKSNTDNSYINGISVGTPIIIAPSVVSMGNHVSCSLNSISPNKIISLINIDTTTKNKYILDNSSVYLVEFKIVPICDIHGEQLENVGEFVDEFVKVVNSESISEDVVLN